MDRFKREVELAYEKAGQPPRKDEPVTIRQAIEIFSRDKTGQGLTGSVLKKYQRELDRFIPKHPAAALSAIKVDVAIICNSQ